jgi:hypothetical protein
MTQSASAVGAAGVPRVGGWDFDQLSGLVLWLDGSSVNEFEGTAPGWTDKSPAGNNFTAVTATPTHVPLETDFPTPQPAVKFDVASSCMDGPIIGNIAWLAVVAIYPATTFADLNLLVSSSGGQFALRGSTGTADWYTSTGAVAGTRYRNGVATNVALTTANTPHLYEFIPSSPWSPGTTLRLSQPHATRRWGDSLGLVLVTDVVPSGSYRANVLARSQELGLIP